MEIRGNYMDFHESTWTSPEEIAQKHENYISDTYPHFIYLLGKSDLYVGDVTPSTSAKSGCAAWNLDKPHLKKHVGPGGVCKFLHMCDQYVTDKGPGGQCLQGHKRTVCTYPKEKKCNAPVRA